MAEKTTSELDKNIGLILKKINDITRNQLIIDAMLLVQGANFLIHPEKAHKGIVESLALTIFFATLSIIIGFIATRGFRRHNLRAIVFAFIFMILAIVAYFTAGYLAPVFHYFIAIVIIFSGFTNILSTYHLTKLSATKKSLKSRLTSEENKDAAVEGVATALKSATKLEAERILSPAIFFSGKVTKFRYGQLFVNLLLIILGTLMFFFRFRTNAVLIRVSGGILIFSAFADLVALLWTHRESAFVRSLTHYNNQSKSKH